MQFPLWRAGIHRIRQLQESHQLKWKGSYLPLNSTQDCPKNFPLTFTSAPAFLNSLYFSVL